MSRSGSTRSKRLRDEGLCQRSAEQAALPSRGQLVLPLVRCLGRAGGEAAPRELYDQVAQELGVPAAERQRTARFADGERNLFERQVRHAQQLAKVLELISTSARGRWTLTTKGEGVLQNAEPGKLRVYFATKSGFAIWGHVEDAVSMVEPGSVDLIYTSPVYPILRRKEYGGLDPANWLPWMLDLVDEWVTLLRPGGSLFMNLGAEVYRRGAPYQSTYLERFVIGVEDRTHLELAQRWFWDNPSKLGNIEWMSKQRRRLRQTVEPVFWWVRTDTGLQDAANNRTVLQPYSDRTRQRYLGQDRSDEARLRPSGIDIGATAFSKDNGGKIPSTLLRAANSGSNDAYQRACRRVGIKAHPATFPASLPERAIQMTTIEDDLVMDPFFGSGTVGAVAERLGRRWIGVERSGLYLEGAKLRFSGVA